jgi:AraC-like DNA-binding protein
MRFVNTTSRIPHLAHNSVWQGGGTATDEWKASQLRVRVLEINWAESDASWDSLGRAESDYLHHIDLVCDGRAQVVHDGRVLDLEPGHGYFLPGNTPTERRCRSRYANYYLRFRVEWFPGIDVLAEWPERAPLCLGRWNRREWEADYPAGQPLSLSKHLKLQSQIAVWLASALPALDSILTAHIRLHGRFEHVFLFVEQNVRADLRVADLAQVYGSGLHAFSMAFRRALGFTPKAYLDRRLNEEVVRRLINTDDHVKQIAADLQFNNEYYFSRFCVRMNGQPPARLRRQLMNSATQPSPASESPRRVPPRRK